MYPDFEVEEHFVETKDEEKNNIVWFKAITIISYLKFGINSIEIISEILPVHKKHFDNVLYINKEGIYELTKISPMYKADKFYEWIDEEIIPKILFLGHPEPCTNRLLTRLILQNKISLELQEEIARNTGITNNLLEKISNNIYAANRNLEVQLTEIRYCSDALALLHKNNYKL